MSTYPLSPIQAALYGALTGDDALMAVVEGVYDHVPQNAAFPYIVFEESAVEPWGLLHESAHMCQLQLDIYSRKGGQKQVMQAAALVRDVLHHTPLVASGWAVALVDVSGANTDRQNDGLTSKANMQVRVWAREVL